MTIRGAGLQPLSPRTLCDDIYHAAFCFVAPQIRSAAIDDFDPLDTVEGNFVPVNPSPKAVVDRYSVEHNQRAARAARTDAAEGDALCLRVVGWRRHHTA